MKKHLSSNSSEKSHLYIVGTPIGNLEDITLRALSVLKKVDSILSEDTRTTKKLLNHYNISTPLKSYRQHQKGKDIAWAKKQLVTGASLAFVSAAGTPGISDPGADLLREVRQENIAQVMPIPGPSALSTALSITGWQTNPSVFVGFLSLRQGRRMKFLQSLKSFPGVIVIYESVHRIRKRLEEIKEIFEGREILIAREMTKIYEEFLTISSGNAANWDKKLEGITLKGEFTIMIAPLKNSPLALALSKSSKTGRFWSSSHFL